MNNRVIIIYFIAFLVCGSISYFGIFPNVSKATSTTAQTIQTQKNLANINQKKQLLTGLSKNENLEKLLTFAVNAIPADTHPNELAAELNSIVQISGNTISGKVVINENGASQPAVANSNNSPDEINFALNLTGDFNSIVKFLNLAEKTSRLISIENVNLTRNSNNTTINAQITGLAYYTKIITTDTEDLSQFEVSTSTIKKLQNLTNPEVTTIPQPEPGFGRLDPFDNIKK